jgi:hypothetical protein
MEDQQPSAAKERKEVHRFELGRQPLQPARLKLVNTGHLNPEWLEWFMGWPMGWTGLEPLEMGKYREWLQSHGGC